MRFLVFIREAFEALRINKMRSFLTMLGIIIGIAAIVIIISVGNGAQSLVFNQVNSFGSDLIGITPGNDEEEGPPASVMGITITSLKNKDIEAIKDNVPDIVAATGYVMGTETMSWGNQSVDATLLGVTSDYINVENADVSLGNFFTADDDQSLGQVVVLGWQVYKDLFNNSDPLGQRIRIKRQSFRVVGVMEERGTAAFQNQDTRVFIPLLTAQKKMLGIDHVSIIRAKAVENSDPAIVQEEVRLALRQSHGLDANELDDFEVVNSETILETLGIITNSLKYFLAAISALSLLVGGIGIMNIMLVSVLERTREIGLRKAVGAKPFDLRLQFLSETIVITLLGGMIGFILGSGFSYLIAIIARSLGYYWEFAIGWSAIMLAIIFPVATGLIFGFYPAQKAARLRPIEALHYE